MQQEIWTAVRPYLSLVRSIDFTGGGEPLLQPKLVDWISEARASGCHVGFLTNGFLLSRKVTDRLLDAGIHWICFSVDSPKKDEYERIRRGSDFLRVTENIRYFTKRKPGTTKVMLNYVMMTTNFEDILDMVGFAKELGIDQINFKQCEVVRGSAGKDYGVFDREESQTIKRRQKRLEAALKMSKKHGLHATATPFIPQERCVCEQDPRDSLFIRYDGVVSPCINVANGGPTTFLGKEVELPNVAYGALPQSDLGSLWQSTICQTYRKIFFERCRQYENGYMEAFLTDSRRTPERIQRVVTRRMPKPPAGCEICHYLYGL